jgi:hypothetical protein
MLEDHLSVVWFERRVRLWERVRHFCAERGMTGPTRKIPLNIGVPLLQNATLEEDDDIQDVWAKLWVNSADASSGIEPRRAFGSVLAEMSLLDVQNLAQIKSATELNEQNGPVGVWTYQLPERAIPYRHLSIGGTPDPSPDVEISLSNLVRLGCIISSNRGPVLQTHYLVNLTPFGRALIEACTR